MMVLYVLFEFSFTTDVDMRKASFFNFGSLLNDQVREYREYARCLRIHPNTC
jgi:hypothetical protein